MNYLMGTFFFTFNESVDLEPDEISVEFIDKNHGMIACLHGIEVSQQELYCFAEDFLRRNILNCYNPSKCNEAILRALCSFTPPEEVFSLICMWSSSCKLNFYVYYDESKQGVSND